MDVRVWLMGTWFHQLDFLIAGKLALKIYRAFDCNSCRPILKS